VRLSVVLSSYMLELRLADFLDEVASPSPLPGSGVTAALTAALAASLIEMAAGCSPDWTGALETTGRARALRERAAALAPANARAYQAARLGRDRRAAGSGDEEAEAALVRAADLPLLICEAAAAVVALGQATLPHVSAELRADVRVAVALAAAASRGAAYLVDANQLTATRDELCRFAREVEGEVDALAAQVHQEAVQERGDQAAVLARGKA
jgi:formiminotetrahydrofolate cyclodeaminase